MSQQINARGLASAMARVYNWLYEYQKEQGNWFVFCTAKQGDYVFAGHGDPPKLNKEFYVECILSSTAYNGISLRFLVDESYQKITKAGFQVGWKRKDGSKIGDNVELARKLDLKATGKQEEHQWFVEGSSEDDIRDALYSWLNEKASVFKGIDSGSLLKVNDVLMSNRKFLEKLKGNNFIVEVDGKLSVPDTAQFDENGADGVVVKKSEKNGDQGDKMLNTVKDLLKSSYRVILTGAPGTGKTYLAEKVAMAMLGKNYTQENWAEAFNAGRVGFCQFHPSYDYSDFVEGLRPVTVGNGENAQVGFKRMDGVFKVFCKNALNGGVRNWNDDFEKAWKLLVSRIDEGSEFGLEIPLISGHGSFALTLNVSGSGLASQKYKDKVGDKDWISGTVKFFSREQLYNVFRGLPGVPSGGHDSYRKAIVDYMKKECGLVEYVKDNTDKQSDAASPYVFIIDEINRGDISKIFGELFFSIDPGYRGAKGLVKTQYQNLVEPDDEFAKGFYVPENVYIIGTMNDIDRSVESMDFAIRRRFVWQEVKANSDVLEEEGARQKIPNAETRKDAKSCMDALNVVIEQELGSEYAIGPAYFFKLPKHQNDFKKLWDMNLKPLLREYLRGNSKDEIAAKMEKFKKAYFESLSETQKRDDKLNAADQNGKDAPGESEA